MTSEESSGTGTAAGAVVMRSRGVVRGRGPGKGRISESNLIDGTLTLDNVAPAAQLTGTSARQARRRAVELLDERPALLQAHEPTGALDSHAGERVMGLLVDLNGQRQTLLSVTHDARPATRCASRRMTRDLERAV